MSSEDRAALQQGADRGFDEAQWADPPPQIETVRGVVKVSSQPDSEAA